MDIISQNKKQTIAIQDGKHLEEEIKKLENARSTLEMLTKTLQNQNNDLEKQNSQIIENEKAKRKALTDEMQENIKRITEQIEKHGEETFQLKQDNQM